VWSPEVGVSFSTASSTATTRVEEFAICVKLEKSLQYRGFVGPGVLISRLMFCFFLGKHAHRLKRGFAAERAFLEIRG
jgi:hypothetical protein